MLRLKPILVFSTAFSIGALIVLYAVFVSSTPLPSKALIWLPVVGTLFGSFALVIRQMNSLWRGITFVFFAMLAFIIYAANQDLRIARDPLSSPHQLEKIYNSIHIYHKKKIFEGLAENEQTPYEILIKISRLNSPSVLAHLGANTKATEEMLQPLLNHKPSYEVHWGLASNPNVSKKFVDFLISAQQKDFSSDKEWHLYETYILAKLVKNPAVTLEQFRVVESQNPNEYFLVMALVESSKSSCETLIRLIKHELKDVHEAALRKVKERNCNP